METSELYDIYRKQFIENCENIVKLDIETEFDAVEKMFADIVTLQRQIDIEHCSLSSQTKSKLLEQLKPYKKIVSQCKISIRKHKQLAQMENSNIIESNFKVRNGQDQRNDQNQKLSESKSLLYDMETINNNINQTLHKQTQTLINLKAKTQSISSILNDAGMIISRMTLKEQKNKVILATVLIAIFIVIYIY